MTPTPTIDPGRRYTPAELAAAAGVSIRTILALRVAGRLGYHRIGTGRGRVRISGQQWLDYLDSCEVKPVATAAGEPDATPPLVSRPPRRHRPAGRRAGRDWDAEAVRALRGT